MDDANYPWVILVPRRDGPREVHELSDADRHRLWDESAQLSRAMLDCFGGDKLNVAALGNVVPQLHVHHVVRFRDDAAWPGPVWGRVPVRRYAPDEADRRISRLCGALGLPLCPAG